MSSRLPVPRLSDSDYRVLDNPALKDTPVHSHAILECTRPVGLGMMRVETPRPTDTVAYTVHIITVRGAQSAVPRPESQVPQCGRFIQNSLLHPDPLEASLICYFIY